MRPVRFSVVCLLGSLVSSVQAEDVVVSRHYLENERVEFEVSRAEWEKVPDWQPTFGQAAPLSRNQALAAAQKAAAIEKLDVSDLSKLVISLEQTNRFEKDLVDRLPPKGCRWFYLVSFKGNDIKLRAKYTFLVTMSGAVATKVFK
jgi:hypothetical protein